MSIRHPTNLSPLGSAALLASACLFFSAQASDTSAAAPSPKWAPGTNHYIDNKLSEYGPFETATMPRGDATLTVFISSAKMSVERSVVEKWIDDAASAVSHYYGGFPVPKATLVLLANGDDGIGGGVTFGGRLIRMRIGPGTAAEELKSDWTLTHEMFHLAFPDLDEDHLWVEEGMAVYFEPLARARVGSMKDEDVWRGMIEGMQNGQPERGDRGLDHTHTWGRTYWGGAMFWFLADLRIRTATGNKHSADDVMRAILKAHGDGAAHWEMANVIAVADKATETHVFSDLYAEAAAKPMSADLPGLWKSLGVSLRGGKVAFDDTAPMAEIRKSLTDPKQNPAK